MNYLELVADKNFPEAKTTSACSICKAYAEGMINILLEDTKKVLRKLCSIKNNNSIKRCSLSESIEMV